LIRAANHSQHRRYVRICESGIQVLGAFLRASTDLPSSSKFDRYKTEFITKYAQSDFLYIREHASSGPRRRDNCNPIPRVEFGWHA